MEIKTEYEYRGKMYKVIYKDGDPLQDSNQLPPHGVHAFCFYNDKFVIVSNSKNQWTPPGGAIEKGETYQDAGVREIKEESNMKVLHQECIGYQDVDVSDVSKGVRQVRLFCVVEPYGDFVSDPDGDIREIRLIDPKDYKEYIHWGEIGNHLMKRALEMYASYKSAQ